VAVEQADRVLAEPERPGRGTIEQAGDSAGGAGGGDGRVIGGQREPGQLHIQHTVTERPRCGTTPDGKQRPGGEGGQSSLFSRAERFDPPGGQRPGGQSDPGRVVDVRVGVQQSQAP